MNKKKIALMVALGVVIIIVAIMFFIPMLSDSTKKPQTNAPDIAATPTTEPQPTVDNSAVSTDVSQTPPEMQAVIDANQADIFVDSENKLAPSYPTNLLPLYKVSGVGDSYDITTDKGNPGWIAVYGSTADTTELVTFYKSLMGSSSGYTESTEGSATNLNGNVNGCDISINITPNNPQRTGFDYASSVNIFIEKVQ